MRSNQNRSSSSSSTTILSSLSQQNENEIVLEPLLSSNREDIEQSFNGLFKIEKTKTFYLNSISRLIPNFETMSIHSAQQCCYASLKWIPVAFLLSILAWSYYAYVVQMCLFTIENLPQKVIYLCIYHPLLIVFLWSYYRTIFQRSRNPPKQFYIGDVQGERISSAQTIDERRAGLIRLARQANLPLLTRHFDGSVRYCFVCQCIKPDRAHHCSVCEQCVLRYDHHCPWTNSCISYGNYKFFVLFLGWSFCFCVYVAGTSLEYFIQFWQNVTNAQKDGQPSTPSSGKFHLLFLFFVSIMFAISISSLFFYHLYLIGKNRTTLESFRSPIFANGPQKEGFNLGLKKNFQEIFGENILKGILPISTTRGDGIHYEMNSMILGYVQQSFNRTNQRNTEVSITIESPSASTTNDRNSLLIDQTNNR